MALSGSFYTNVGSHWRLQLEWTGSQSISGNYTDVTAKLYWMALDGYGAVSSSATKTCAISFDGSSYSHSASGMASLSGNQKKLIYSYTKRIYHNDDGTGDVTLDGYFDAEVTLGGTYYGRINLTAHTYTLNTIPRKSTLTSSVSWTAGSNFTISISRKSSNFTHRAYIDIQDSGGTWHNVKYVDFSTSETSKSSNFSTSENTTIFDYLNGASSRTVRINLYTYDSSTVGENSLGYNTYTGTVTAPSASTGKITNPTGISDASDQGNSTVWIDQDISISITRHNSAFTHTLKFKDGNSGSVIHTATGVGTSYTWTPSQSEKDYMYSKCPNSNEFDGQLDIYTYYNGVLVRSATAMDINYRVRNSNPIFGTGYTYKDTDATTTSITENNQYIIQNKSTVLVEIPTSAMATAVNGATMSSYKATLAGKSITQPFSNSATVSFDFGTIDATNNQILEIKAIDSRGNSTTTSINVIIVPYSNPTVNSTANRINGFESDTTITLKGSFSPISISGSSKNSITSLQYRYKASNTSTWGSWTNFTYTNTGSNYTATDVTLTLDNLQSWNIEIKVVDKVSSTTVSLTVDTGKPIFFIDTLNKSLGFGDFPNSANQFLINGRITFGSTVWNGTGGIGEGKGAIELNNSDITQANGIWFNDVSEDNNGEGLLFLKPGKASGSTDKADYDNLLVRGGVVYLNGNAIGSSSQTELWSGAWYMTDSQTVPLSGTKSLSNQPNGWLLVWSDYDAPTNTTNNYNFVFSFIPKWFATTGYVDVLCAVASSYSASSTNMTIKELKITNTSIVGLPGNRDNYYDNDVVLRYVLGV